MTDRREQDLAFQEWVQRARDVQTFDAAMKLHFTPLRRSGGAFAGGKLKRLGACTACGASGSRKPEHSDRFCVFIAGPKAGGFRCRQCNIHGGDAISLVQQSLGHTFLEAVEFLTGDPPPRGKDARSEAEKAEAREKIEAKKRENEARLAEAENAVAKDRANRERWARDLWSHTRPVPDTPVLGYLNHRGIHTLAGLNLDHCGFAASLKLKDEDGALLHEGPAMVWQVTNARGEMTAVHRTWLAPEDFGRSDADGRRLKGRPAIIDSETGRKVATKKTLGTKEGCVIRVSWHGPAAPRPWRLFIAEGLETLLSVREAMIRAGHAMLDGAAWWCACDLENIAQVPVPAVIREVVLLGDGDSERKTIERVFWAHMKANATPGRVFVPAFAADGKDFNDMLEVA